MNSRLICMGKTDDQLIRGLLDDYLKRINRYSSCTILEIPNLKKASSMKEEEVRSAEADLILSQVTKDDYMVLLDERGEKIRSRDFASFLNQRFLSGMKGLVFIIGGAFGVDERIKKRADYILSLSRMTFPHQLVRLLFTEQLYRALTILRNEPYHHE
ncbi:MAG: 23S rRNA (pseudouridine(1915)-N(3))-methyltransferase RlmH [Bacteroidales bacterium]|nr:23S rRNA (pseudouridine(1915)-N(3))-methyltransferase RlmH [Bacteroidales bacterium]